MNIVTTVRDTLVKWYSYLMYTGASVQEMDAVSAYPTEVTEPDFTTVLLGIIADYIDKNPAGTKPHITRMENNRFLWQSGRLTMSVTINDISREYT